MAALLPGHLQQWGDALMQGCAHASNAQACYRSGETMHGLASALQLLGVCPLGMRVILMPGRLLSFEESARSSIGGDKTIVRGVCTCLGGV